MEKSCDTQSSSDSETRTLIQADMGRLVSPEVGEADAASERFGQAAWSDVDECLGDMALCRAKSFFAKERIELDPNLSATQLLLKYAKHAQASVYNYCKDKLKVLDVDYLLKKTPHPFISRHVGQTFTAAMQSLLKSKKPRKVTKVTYIEDVRTYNSSQLLNTFQKLCENWAQGKTARRDKRRRRRGRKKAPRARRSILESVENRAEVESICLKLQICDASLTFWKNGSPKADGQKSKWEEECDKDVHLRHQCQQYCTKHQCTTPECAPYCDCNVKECTKRTCYNINITTPAGQGQTSEGSLGRNKGISKQKARRQGGPTHRRRSAQQAPQPAKVKSVCPPINLAPCCQQSQRQPNQLYQAIEAVNHKDSQDKQIPMWNSSCGECLPASQHIIDAGVCISDIVRRGPRLLNGILFSESNPGALESADPAFQWTPRKQFLPFSSPCEIMRMQPIRAAFSRWGASPNSFSTGTIKDPDLAMDGANERPVTGGLYGKVLKPWTAQAKQNMQTAAIKHEEMQKSRAAAFMKRSEQATKARTQEAVFKKNETQAHYLYAKKLNGQAKELEKQLDAQLSDAMSPYKQARSKCNQDYKAAKEACEQTSFQSSSNRRRTKVPEVPSALLSCLNEAKAKQASCASLVNDKYPQSWIQQVRKKYDRRWKPYHWEQGLGGGEAADRWHAHQAWARQKIAQSGALATERGNAWRPQAGTFKAIPGCADNPVRRRNGKSCGELRENGYCDIARTSRRRHWGGEVATTCHQTCEFCGTNFAQDTRIVEHAERRRRKKEEELLSAAEVLQLGQGDQAVQRQQDESYLETLLRESAAVQSSRRRHSRGRRRGKRRQARQRWGKNRQVRQHQRGSRRGRSRRPNKTFEFPWDRTLSKLFVPVAFHSSVHLQENYYFTRDMTSANVSVIKKKKQVNGTMLTKNLLCVSWYAQQSTKASNNFGGESSQKGLCHGDTISIPMNLDVCLSRYQSIVDLQETRRVCEAAHPTWSPMKINQDCVALPESLHKCHAMPGRNNQTNCSIPVKCSVFECRDEDIATKRRKANRSRRRPRCRRRPLGRRLPSLRDELGDSLGSGEPRSAQISAAARDVKRSWGLLKCQGATVASSTRKRRRAQKKASTCQTKLKEAKDTRHDQEMFKRCRTYHPTWSSFDLYKYCVKPRKLDAKKPRKMGCENPNYDKCVLREEPSVDYLTKVASLCEQRAYEKIQKCCTSSRADMESSSEAAYLQAEVALKDF